MKSYTTDRFWKCYTGLPVDIKKRAKTTYKVFQNDPYHPSLHFKRIHSSRPIFFIRITLDYRALGVMQENRIIWFWIGSHSEYDKLLKK